jgi:hypothetical protein
MAVLILLLQIIIGAILHLLAVTLVEAGAAVVAIQAVAEEVILLAEVVAMAAAEGAAEVAFVVGDKKLNSRFIGRAEYLEESRGCPLFYTKRKR